MKARMLDKAVEEGTYTCIRCSSDFDLHNSDIKCTCCGNNESDELVAIYIEDDQLEEMLYCKIDWHGG